MLLEAITTIFAQWTSYTLEKKCFPSIISVTQGIPAEVMGAGADAFCSRAGERDRQGFFFSIQATQSSQGSHQDPATLAREADEA